MYKKITRKYKKSTIKLNQWVFQKNIIQDNDPLWAHK